MEHEKFPVRADPYTHPIVTALLKKYAPNAQNILDVGCGSGAFLYTCKDFIRERFGCDADTTQYREEENRRNIRQVDFTKEPLPYSDNEFDVLTCIEVVEHVLNPEKLISECLAVLKENHFLILTSPNVHSIIQRLYFLLTGNLMGFYDANHNLYERHKMPIFEGMLEEIIRGKGKIAEKTYNRTIVPIIRTELGVKNSFLSESAIWVIQKSTS